VEILIRTGKGAYFDQRSGVVDLLIDQNGVELEIGIDICGGQPTLVRAIQVYEAIQAPA
jgi:hypothetical protein